MILIALLPDGCGMNKRIQIGTKLPKTRVLRLPYPEPGSRAWRRARGLQTLSDLSHEYEAVRNSRGDYSVSLPEDLR